MTDAPAAPVKRPLTRERPLVFVDLETTGLDPEAHEIIELAAIKIDPATDTEIACLDVKIRPSEEGLRRAEPIALQINGYSPELWANAVEPDKALAAFAAIAEGAIFVAHNVVFDWSFIKASFKRASVPLPRLEHQLLDTASLAWPFVRSGAAEGMALRKLCALFGISNEGEHSAMGDVRRTLALYRKLVGSFASSAVVGAAGPTAPPVGTSTVGTMGTMGTANAPQPPSGANGGTSGA